MVKRSRPIPSAQVLTTWSDEELQTQLSQSSGKRKNAIEKEVRRRQVDAGLPAIAPVVNGPENEEPPSKRQKVAGVPGTSEAVLYARFSEAVYHHNPPERMKKWGNFRVWELLVHYTTKTLNAWYHGPSDTLVIALRGTADAQDVITDIALVLGKELLTPRYMTALLTTRKAYNEYTPNRVVFCGHSLGGAVALTLHHAWQGLSDCFLYNPGITQRNAVWLRAKGVNDFYVKGDVVSALGQLTHPNRVKASKAGLNRHTIGQFTS